ncbi:hypothetical protein FF1_006868 [Malus domestica]
MADALANLASSMTPGEEEAADVPVCQRWVIPIITEMLLDDTNVISVLPIDAEEWRQPLINYFEHGKLLDDPRHPLKYVDEHLTFSTTKEHSTNARLKEYF